MNYIKKLALIAITLIAATACLRNGWSDEEQKIINEQGDIMRVLTVCNAADSMLLRSTSLPISNKELRSNEYNTLAKKMVATVTSPEQDGVGIAAPQVGILRRIVAVQRFDKDEAPFEVYPNIRITSYTGEKEIGPEGCLSIPNRRGDVARYRDINITYTSLRTLNDTTEKIKGFTAVIFQHECDHLDGILYTDHIQ